MRGLVIALVIQLILAGVLIYFAVTGFPFLSGTAAAAPAHTPFSGARAYALVREQVGLGPRPAGSQASRRLAARLRARLPGGRFEAVAGGLRNVVGSLPGSGPAIVVAAHYDTKDIRGFVGANDGAAGTAVVVEIARALAAERAAGRWPAGPGVRFVLFDGEESPRGTPDVDFATAGLRGSRAYVAAHPGEVRELVLLDFVGNRRLTLPREAGSDRALWIRLRAAARAVGAGAAFPLRSTGEILDDHTPFARAGIPAIDLIDFDYPAFHTTADTLAQISRRSLDAVGRSVLELVRRERAARTP